MSTSTKVFISGITGNQGGAVARQLVKKGYHVTGLTRNKQSDKARLLHELEVELIEGDLEVPDSYETVLKNVDVIFFVQALKHKNLEINEAKQFLSTVKRIDDKHLIYASVLGANLNTGVPHFDSKGVIEQLVKETSNSYTILRLASFYENYLYPQVYNGIKKGKFMSPLNKNCRQQMIGLSHIASIVSQIIEKPETYRGKTIEVATDEYDMTNLAAVFSEVLGKSVKYQKLPGLLTRIFMGRQLYKMFKYMNKHEFCLVNNIQEVRNEFNIQSNFRDWVEIHFSQ